MQLDKNIHWVPTFAEVFLEGDLDIYDYKKTIAKYKEEEIKEKLGMLKAKEEFERTKNKIIKNNSYSTWFEKYC
jgi:hypothetical protein